MALVGYARVSTTDQDLTHQIAVLTTAGCRKIFSEKMTGTRKEGRQALDECLDYLREGDTLVVTRIDRLSRSLRDLQNLVHELEGQNIRLRATEQAIDTSSPNSRHASGRNANEKALPGQKPKEHIRKKTHRSRENAAGH